MTTFSLILCAERLENGGSTLSSGYSELEVW